MSAMTPAEFDARMGDIALRIARRKIALARIDTERAACADELAADRAEFEVLASKQVQR